MRLLLTDVRVIFSETSREGLQTTPVYLKIDTLLSCGGVTSRWLAMTSGASLGCAAAANVLRIIQWLLFSCEIQIKLR